MWMRRVVLESPFSGDVPRNILYARRAIRDSILRNEAPLASHLLYTQDGVLDDGILEERIRGMWAGWNWISYCHALVVYRDYGISNGMMGGIRHAEVENIRIEYREIGINKT